MPQMTASAETLTRRQRVAWRNAVFAMFFLSGLSVASWVARIPAVRDDTGITLDVVGVVILGMSFGSVVGLIVAPALLARFGARRSMILALFLVTIGMTVIGLGSTLFALPAVVFAGMVVFGFGNGSVDVMMNVEGALAEKANGKTLMPLMHAFFSFGTLAGAGIGALASWAGIAVAWHLIPIGLAIAVAVVIAVRFIPVTAEAEDEGTDAPPMPWRQKLRQNLSVWTDVRLLLIGLVMLGMSFAEGGANDWIALAVVDGHSGIADDPAQLNTMGAVIFGVFTAAMTLSRVLGGPILDRFGRVAVLRVCVALGVGGMLLFIFGGQVWMLVVGTALWALGCSLGFPVGMSAAADHPNAAARVSAVAIIGYCAFLAGPPLLGWVGQHFGILNALLIIVVLLVFSGLAAPAVREQRKAPAAGV